MLSWQTREIARWFSFLWESNCHGVDGGMELPLGFGKGQIDLFVEQNTAVCLEEGDTGWLHKLGWRTGFWTRILATRWLKQRSSSPPLGGEHVAAKRPAATRTSLGRRVNVEMRDFSREQGYVSSQGGG